MESAGTWREAEGKKEEKEGGGEGRKKREEKGGGRGERKEG
jgi:hypothetical protein